MRKFLSVFLSILLCIFIIAGFLIEGYHYGIKNTVRNMAKKGSVESELPRDNSGSGKTEQSSGKQSMTLLRAQQEDIDYINTVSLVLDDTTLTLIGSAFCYALDECKVSYKRSDIMSIMNDIKNSEVINNILFEVAVKIVNKKKGSSSSQYTTDEIIEVIEEHKDEVESFFRGEFKKFDINITQDMLDKVAKVCSNKTKTQIKLSIDDKYVFTHLIEAIIAAFRDVINSYLDEYLSSIQHFIALLLQNVLKDAGIEYDQAIVNGIAYDIVNSDDIIDLMYEIMSKAAELVTTGNTWDTAEELGEIIDRNSEKIDRFVRGELLKYDLKITPDTAAKIDKWYQETFDTTKTLDPNSPTYFSDILKGYAESMNDMLGSIMGEDSEVFEELEDYIPMELVRALAYILPEENMTMTRITYVCSSVVASLLIFAVASPHIRVLKSIGVSGIVAGALTMTHAGLLYLAGYILGRFDIAVVKVLAESTGQHLLTIGLVSFGVGLGVTIFHAIVASSMAKAAAAGAATAAASAATAPTAATEPVPEIQNEQPTESTEEPSEPSDEPTKPSEEPAEQPEPVEEQPAKTEESEPTESTEEQPEETEKTESENQ